MGSEKLGLKHMLKSPCHPDKKLALRGKSTRAGVPILLLSCPVCGNKYQATDSKYSHVYQSKKKALYETKSIKVNGRMKKSEYEKIIRVYGSFQKFIDSIKRCDTLAV